METKTKVFEVQTEVTVKESGNRLIFNKDNESGKWVYHAPNAQDHTEEEIEFVLQKLKELNK